jgi:hypothetical protein
MEVSMKKKMFTIIASVLLITLASAGVVGAQALPGLLLEEEKLEATGYVDEFEMDYLVVDGVRYELTMDTEIEEEIEVDDFVKVKYYEEEELFIALEVELEDEEFEEFEAEGYVDEYLMDEYIIIDGVRYELTMDTEIEEEIEVGDFVKVKYYEEEGLFIALEVELKDKDDDDIDDGSVCSGEIIHPALESLAMTFGVAYEELLPYFCEQNFGIGEIKHALETAEHEDVEMTWQELLAWRHNAGWGEIWQDLGLIGKDKNKNGETLEIQEQEQEKVKTNNGKSDDNPGKGKGKDKND